MHARISELWRYPVKSCAGTSVPALTLDAQGWPIGDRGWAVANSAHELTWMGEHPSLTWVQGEQLADASLLLKARDGQHCQLAADAGRSVTVSIWSETLRQHLPYEGWDAGDEAADLLRRMTGADLRLVRLSTAARCRDGAQALHVLSQASLDAWRQAHPAVNRRTQRARANVVLEAVAEDDGFPPFLEDLLRGLRAPHAQLASAAPCLRCVVPAVDPVMATLDDGATAALTRLSAERAPGEAVRFGVYLRGVGPGELRVGDLVELDLNFA